MKLLTLLFLIFCPLLFAKTEGNNFSKKITSLDELMGKQYVSTYSQKIKVYKYYNRKDKNKKVKKILILSGVHGNEIESVRFAEELVRHLDNNSSILSSLSNVEITILPQLNPDSYPSVRTNPNKVDLNRNYSVFWGKSRYAMDIGTSPFSERETKNLRDFFTKEKFDLAMDIHCCDNRVIVPSARDSLMDRYWSWIGVVSNNLRILDNYSFRSSMDPSFGDGGAFDDWAFWEMNAYAGTLEVEKTLVRNDRVDNGLYLKYETFLFSLIESLEELR